MKLNLGCGSDIKPGYVNVDARDLGLMSEQRDLSKFPWPWADGSIDEIMMLDFLEHFPYDQTNRVLQECWRVLKMGGTLITQVPDLEHCSRAALLRFPFMCNRCGWEFKESEKISLMADLYKCRNCKQSWFDIAQAAVHRLYGGQDYPGNFHFTAFSKILLMVIMTGSGFSEFIELEKEHQWANWNLKFSAKKVPNLWSEY